MPKRGLERRYLAMCAAAHEAGDLLRRRFLDRDNRTYKLKGPQDYLTETDSEAERLIAGRLTAAFADDGVLGEEGGGRFAPELWVIDPIDGTANFARGAPHFCVSIAFMRDGRIELGAIYDPMQGDLYAARRGGGATLNGRPMRVSPIVDIRRATIELGWSTRRPNADYTAIVQRVLDSGASFRRSGSGALGLAYVADGRQDGYFELHINSWDALAGVLLVQEAGGWTNDFLAGDVLVNGNPVLALTPGIREALCALVSVGG